MDKKFQIDQLRKDKIIYAVEAAATNLACLLVMVYAYWNLTGIIKNIFVGGSLLVGVLYTGYMGVGNYFRLQKIIKLEAQL